jgi:hypothetical protein
VDELQSQLKEIQEELKLTGNCPGTTEELIARYAAKLQEADENAGSNVDPKKLVTDLLARCLLWQEIIRQR